MHNNVGWDANFQYKIHLQEGPIGAHSRTRSANDGLQISRFKQISFGQIHQRPYLYFLSSWR